MQTLQASVSSVQCASCGYELEASARFCGFCGALTPAQGAPQFATPQFANVPVIQPPVISNELQEEAARLLMHLARERFLLCFHWAMFIGLNLLGCYLAIRCYFGFIGDEMSKIMVASTPFLYINCMALLFIVCIRGTRKAIARLKEQISYVKFKIDFGHLM
jgi:hypothetical protein